MSKGGGGSTSERKPMPKSVYGRTPKKSEPDDIPGHAQTSRGSPSTGRNISASSFKPGNVKKRLKGVMI